MTQTVSGALSVIIVISAGLLGAWVFSRARWPAGDLIGSLLLVAVVSATGLVASLTLPAWISFGLQVAIGSAIGCSVTPDTLRALRSLAIPALLVMSWVVASTFGFGWLIQWMTDIDYTTAVLSSCPGGIAEVSLLAVSFQAEAPVIVAFQLVRFFVVVIVVPTFVAVLHRHRQANGTSHSHGRIGEQGPIAAIECSECEAEPFAAAPLRSLACLVVGLAGGLLAYVLHLPAPGIIGSLSATALAQLVHLRLPPPPNLIQVGTRIGLGIILGAAVDRQVLAETVGLGTPIMIVIVGLIVSGAIVGFLIHKVTGWDPASGLLSCSAAGLVQMAVTAESLGLDPVRVSLLHLVRMLTIVMVVPVILAVVR